MLQVDNLSLAYGEETLFRDISFVIQRKERCGLLGRNGSGKTTLLRILTSQEKPDTGVISTPKGYTLGYLDQHIRFSQKTIREEAALGLPPDEREDLYKAEAILFGIGFKEEDLDKPPEILSGGYHLRLHLAKVLLSKPDCLLLDEPTNYLDILSIRWFGNFLRDWPGEFILITHDREFMDHVTTHTMGIHRKSLRKVKGSTTDFFEQIVLEEEVHEKTRMNLEKKRQHAQSYIERFGAKATKAAQAQSKRKMIERIPVLEKLKSLYELDFSFVEAPFPGKKMLDAKEIDFSYEKEKPIISDFSISIEAGERVAIIGKNGIGKSTLLRLLAKELPPHHGSVHLQENVRLGYFGQTNIDRLHPTHSIEEEISTANPSLNFTQVKAICGVVMFSGNLAKKSISVLSGGERSRVLLGKILAKPCNLLLLDEPTHHLDMESIEALIDALEDFTGSILLVTHSELILKRLCLDKIVHCHKGQQNTFLGSYEEFLEKIGWSEEGKSSKEKKNDYHENKKRRSELINLRAKTLKPLEIEIKKCEDEIAKLEIEQSKDMELLAVSSAEKTKELSKNVGIRQKKIDTLFADLEKTTLVYEDKKVEFDNQIKELGP